MEKICNHQLGILNTWDGAIKLTSESDLVSKLTWEGSTYQEWITSLKEDFKPHNFCPLCGTKVTISQDEILKAIQTEALKRDNKIQWWEVEEFKKQIEIYFKTV